MSNLSSATVTTESGYSWTTDMARNVTKEMAESHFLGESFDVSRDPEREQMETVVKVDFTPAKEG